MKDLILLISFCLAIFTASVSSKALYGLNYGVNRDNCPTLNAVKSDFRVLSQYTNILRVYSIKDCNLGELALQAAQATKMKLYLGMWVDQTDAFQQELRTLKRLVDSKNKFYNVEAIIVGSEVMYRGNVTAKTLVNNIEKVKTLMHPLGVQVTTAEVYYKFDPKVVDAVDFLMMNAFIYWEGSSVKSASDLIISHYNTVKALAKGKTVRISETGWPDDGAIFKDSAPSPQNQKKFLYDSLCVTKAHGIDMIWFSAIDEEYKSGVEGHFGLLGSNRQLKKEFTYNGLIDPPC